MSIMVEPKLQPTLAVTEVDALAFAENALRNWDIEGFSADDLEDLRAGLQLFVRHRNAALEAISALRVLAGSAFATLHTIATASECEQSRAAAKETADEIDAALKEPSA